MFDFLRQSLSIAVLMFVLGIVCNGQESSDSVQTLSIGDRLLRVEEKFNDLRSRSKPTNIELVRKCERELKSILESDPQTVFRSQVEVDLDFVNEQLANHDLLVAQFYMSKAGGHGLRGAEARLSNIVENYPKFSKLDEVLFRLATVMIEEEKLDEGSRLLQRLICRYPDSEFVPPAFAQLYNIGVGSWQNCE